MLHNIILQTCLLLVAILIAGVKSLDFTSKVSEFQKDISKGNDDTQRQINALLLLQQVLQSNLLILNIFILTFLAISQYSIYQDVAFAFLWLISVHLLANTAFLQRRARTYTQKHFKQLLRLAVGLQPALALLSDSRLLVMRNSKHVYSRTELIDAIENSKDVLTPNEREAIQAILAGADGDSSLQLAGKSDSSSE